MYHISILGHADEDDYGERLGDEASLLYLYQNLGERLRQACLNWEAAVFTGGLLTELVGVGAFFAFWPLVAKIPGMTGYTTLLYVYVVMSVLRNLCSQFVRAKQYTRLYAVDGVLNTVLYLFFIDSKYKYRAKKYHETISHCFSSKGKLSLTCVM